MVEDSESRHLMESMRKQLELMMSKVESAENQIAALMMKEE